MIDIDMLIADRATRGEFTIEERLAESSGSSFYVVTSTTRKRPFQPAPPGFGLF